MVRLNDPPSRRSDEASVAAPTARLRPARIMITDVDVDLWRARGTDTHGRPCFADHRSAISISALREGQRWHVLLTPQGLIKSFSEPPTPYRRPRRASGQRRR